MSRKTRPHWYRLYYGGCPICCTDKSYRERVYEEDEARPEDPAKRTFYLSDTECYDWCDAL